MVDVEKLRTHAQEATARLNEALLSESGLKGHVVRHSHTSWTRKAPFVYDFVVERAEELVNGQVVLSGRLVKNGALTESAHHAVLDTVQDLGVWDES